MISKETAIILSKVESLLEAACETCEDLEDVKESLEDAMEKIDDVLKDCKEDNKKDKISDETKEVVNEAIDALYEKAALCESADEASVYIQKAEELQDAIEDIPEEKPVVDDEYPADDVTGGEGEKLDHEEIKDLVGNDDEALKILLTDDNSVTIDAE